MYLKIISLPRLNALENGDFLNFIFYFLAAKHELIHNQQDMSQMKQNASNKNVPYNNEKTFNAFFLRPQTQPKKDNQT